MKFFSFIQNRSAIKIIIMFCGESTWGCARIFGYTYLRILGEGNKKFLFFFVYRDQYFCSLLLAFLTHIYVPTSFRFIEKI